MQCKFLIYLFLASSALLNIALPLYAQGSPPKDWCDFYAAIEQGESPKYPVEMGKEISASEVNFSIPPGAKVLYIDKGENGYVYRILLADHSSYIIKQYSHVSSCEKDFELMKILRDVQGSGTKGFYAPKVEKISDKILKIEDIRGQTLRDVIINPNGNGRNYIQIYQSNMQELIKQLKLKFGEDKVRWFDRHITIDTDGGKKTIFFLKYDNIILESDTERMAIIDPQ